jgi:hypothetical protein
MHLLQKMCVTCPTHNDAYIDQTHNEHQHGWVFGNVKKYQLQGKKRVL